MPGSAKINGIMTDMVFSYRKGTLNMWIFHDSHKACCDFQDPNTLTRWTPLTHWYFTVRAQLNIVHTVNGQFKWPMLGEWAEPPERRSSWAELGCSPSEPCSTLGTCQPPQSGHQIPRSSWVLCYWALYHHTSRTPESFYLYIHIHLAVERHPNLKAYKEKKQKNVMENHGSTKLAG